MRNRRLFALAVLVLMGCGLPRDPAGTLDKVSGGVLRVGVSENPPWVILSEPEPEGAEVSIVRDLANDLEAELEWFEDTEAELIGALERRELDIVIAGLTIPSPWTEEAAITKHYFLSSVVIVVPEGTDEPRELDGLEVFVEKGTEAAALVAARGAIPRGVDDLGEPEGPAAVESWQVAQLGMIETEHVLTQHKHVMAVPPGENAFLTYVERFLRSKRSQVPDLLRQHAR